MLKRILCLIILTLSSSIFAGEEKIPVVPEIFSEEDLSGSNPEFLEKYFILANFEQRLQLGDGKLSQKPGKVLVIENGGTTFFAFYYLTDAGKYRKIGRTLATKDINFPRQDMHPEYNIPCLIVTKKDNKGVYRIYLYNGKTVIQKVKTETPNK